ncbi:MAG: MMPL family transporter [Bacteroidales bacterium]|nr:MMPL family transporter [Bacteroidales bacterium]
MWQKIARLILRKKLYLIIGLVVVTAFLGYEALHVRMDYGYARMLSEDDEVFLQNKKFKELFGDEANAIAIGIDDSLMLSDYEHFVKFRNFARQIKDHKEVKSTFGPLEAVSLNMATVEGENGQKRRAFAPTKIFSDSISSQAELDSAANVFFGLPFYTNLLYSIDTNVFLFTITLNPEILNSSERQQSVAEIEDIMNKYSEDAGVGTHISGHPYIRTEITNLVKRELLIFTLLAALVCIIVLFFFFRSFKIIFAALIVVALSLVWSFGYMALFDYQITILTSMIPPLLIVIGIPNIIYMFNKYHSEFKMHGQKIKALHRTICKIGNASFVTNLTTACGFATFIVTSNSLLIEFGVVASLGIMTVFLLSLLIIPIYFSLSKPPSVKATKHIDNKVITGVIEKIESIVTYRRPRVYAVFITVAVVMIGGIFMIDRAGYILDDVPEDSALCKDTRFLEDKFGGVSPIEMVVISKDTLRNDLDYVDQIERLDSLQQRLKKYPELSRSMSIADAVKFLYQSLKTGNNYELPPTPDTYSTIMKRMPDAKNVGLAKSFIDSTRTATRISMNIKDVGCDRIEELLPLLKNDLSEVFPAEKYETIVTGSSIMNYTGTTYLTKNLFISLALAILVIALFLFIMFRSVKVTLLSLIPNVIPMVVTAGVMGYFGIPIKPSTILVFSIAFGISVDDTIHYLAKYSQELKHTDGNIGISVRNALSETGMSMIYTSIILVLGFGIFIISAYGGSRSMGILVSTALFVAMFSNIVLLPSLLMTLEHHFNKKVFKEQFIQIYNEEDEIDLDELKIEGEEYDENK